MLNYEIIKLNNGAAIDIHNGTNARSVYTVDTKLLSISP